MQKEIHSSSLLRRSYLLKPDTLRCAFQKTGISIAWIQFIVVFALCSLWMLLSVQNNNLFFGEILASSFIVNSVMLLRALGNNS